MSIAFKAVHIPNRDPDHLSIIGDVFVFGIISMRKNVQVFDTNLRAVMINSISQQSIGLFDHSDRCNTHIYALD